MGNRTSETVRERAAARRQRSSRLRAKSLASRRPAAGSAWLNARASLVSTQPPASSQRRLPPNSLVNSFAMPVATSATRVRGFSHPRSSSASDLESERTRMILSGSRYRLVGGFWLSIKASSVAVRSRIFMQSGQVQGHTVGRSLVPGHRFGSWGTLSQRSLCQKKPERIPAMQRARSKPVSSRLPPKQLPDSLL